MEWRDAHQTIHGVSGWHLYSPPLDRLLDMLLDRLLCILSGGYPPLRPQQAALPRGLCGWPHADGLPLSARCLAFHTSACALHTRALVLAWRSLPRNSVVVCVLVLRTALVARCTVDAWPGPTMCARGSRAWHPSPPPPPPSRRPPPLRRCPRPHGASHLHVERGNFEFQDDVRE